MEIEKIKDRDKKLHWHCFSYSGSTINLDYEAIACSYVGLPTKNITKFQINTQKTYAGLS